jgi:hypothetical protein
MDYSAGETCFDWYIDHRPLHRSVKDQNSMGRVLEWKKASLGQHFKVTVGWPTVVLLPATFLCTYVLPAIILLDRTDPS